MGKFVALLRGINVGGKNKIGMAQLRPLCEGLGWAGVQSYIQSGNVVFEAPGLARRHEAALEGAISAAFGLSVPVIVRAGGQWPDYVASNPFAEAAEDEPNRLMLCLSKSPLGPEAGSTLQERARDGERIAQVGDALWIHYPSGAGTSRLSPAMIDRAAGSTVTARNWRTVLHLHQMLGA